LAERTLRLKSGTGISKKEPKRVRNDEKVQKELNSLGGEKKKVVGRRNKVETKRQKIAPEEKEA